MQQKQASAKKLRGADLLLKSVLVLISVGVTIAGVEFAARLLPPPYDADEGVNVTFNDQANDILTCGNNFGWAGTPNFQGVMELAESRVNLTLNSRGHHDTDHSIQKESDTFRILMLGDSFVHAIQVDETATNHQVLEDYLNQSRADSSTWIEVISGGVTGWGTGQEIIYYREQGRRYQADLVLLMLFIGNDFENNLPGHVLTIQGANCYAPYFALCNDQVNPEPLPYAPGISDLQNNCSTSRRLLITAMGTLYQKSHLYQQLEPLIISNRPRQVFGQSYPNPFWALYLPNDEVALKQAWPVTLGLINHLQQEVEADGAQFAVAFFPWSAIIQLSLLTPAEQAALLSQTPEFAGIEADRPNRRLVTFFTEHNIPFIDLTAPLIEHQSSQAAPLHFVGDSHWTGEGNRFVAETLANWLTQSSLLSQ